MTNSRPDDTARKLLVTSPAPAGLACVSTLTTQLKGGVTLTLAYVPDRRLLERADFEAYAAARSRVPPVSVEALAASIAEDVANEMVPRWARVTVEVAGVTSQRVVVEDRQPGWDHPTLLKSL